MRREIESLARNMPTLDDYMAGLIRYLALKER
jgi:hypothetical protein